MSAATVAVCVVICLVPSGCRASPDTRAGASATAITHVNVVPMDRNVVLEDQTVVVTGRRITQIGPAATTTVPSGARLVDGAGRFLMPGLADMHVHLQFESDLLLFVANGVTTVRNLFGSPTYLRWREEIQRGERFGPSIYTSGPIVDGDPPRWPGSDVVTTPAEAQEVVRRQARAGYDFVKVYDGLSTAAYDAIVQTAREEHIPVVGHVPRGTTVRHVLRSGQASIEHMFGFGIATSRSAGPSDGAGAGVMGILAGWEDFDEAKMRALAAEIRQSGAWITPTLLADQEFNPPDQIAARLRAPEMRFVDPRIRNFWRGIQHDPKEIEMARRAEPKRKLALRMLRDAGVPLLLGTDCPNELIAPGFSVPAELREMVDAGLTPFEALESATYGAATFLGAADVFGSVSKGGRADLVLVEGNPLNDVANVTRRVGVMVRGVWYPEADLQSRLETLAEGYASAAAPLRRDK